MWHCLYLVVEGPSLNVAASLFQVDELDEMEAPGAEAPAPEPLFVEKLCAEPRVYDLTAIFNWTAARHPVNYPDNASWSPLFGVVHNEEYVLCLHVAFPSTLFVCLRKKYAVVLEYRLQVLRINNFKCLYVPHHTTTFS